VLENIAWKDLLRHILKDRLFQVGLILTLCLIVVVIVGPYVSPYSPFSTDPAHKLQGPSLSHPFGTDDVGRDVLSRTLYGARISIILAVTVVIASGVIGTVIGIVSGYFGGAIDNILMRITDVFLAFPPLILAMVIATVLGRGLIQVGLAVVFTMWTEFARLARGQALIVKEQNYVEAARAIGASNWRILFIHVLPGCISPLIVQGTVDIGWAILLLAGLGFLGLGAQPPTPEWGVMVAQGRDFLPAMWWICVFPGLAIVLTVVAVNLLGDGLRDVLDPRRR